MFQGTLCSNTLHLQRHVCTACTVASAAQSIHCNDRPVSARPLSHMIDGTDDGEMSMPLLVSNDYPCQLARFVPCAPGFQMLGVDGSAWAVDSPFWL
jgi:hypothetical protein